MYVGVSSQRRRKPRCTPSFLSGVSEFFVSKHDSGKRSVVSPELWECPRIVSGGGEVSPRNVSGGSAARSVSHRRLLRALETLSPYQQRGHQQLRVKTSCYGRSTAGMGLVAHFRQPARQPWILSLVPPESRRWEVAWSTGDCLGFL